MKISRKLGAALFLPVIINPVMEISCSSSPVMKKKPVNILFLLADDERAGTINSLGNSEIITPNLDKLVRKGTSFTHAYIMGGSQGAVSVPSRAMIMTGRFLSHLEKTGTVIPEDQIMLCEVLKKAGYNTHGIGKWHNGPESYARSFLSGSEIFFGGMTDQFNVNVWNFDPSGKYKADSVLNQPHINKNKHSSELFADAAINFLKNYKKDKPFFLYVAFTSPHDPRKMPPEYLKMYDTAKIKLPPNFMPQHNFDNGELKVRDELLAGFPRTIPEIKGHIRDYYAMITHLDAQIGRIIDALKESGEYENTIIIFSGDNGLALGQHGLMGKQNVYEHSVGVPLIWSGPGIPENQKRDAFVYLLDIYPTICEIIGIKVPDSVDGTSIKQCILDKNAQIRTSLYFSYRDFQRSVRDREYKLIEYNVSGKRTTQLFNIGADPWEKNNLADDPEYRNKLKSMRKAMLEQKKLTDDNGPFWEGIDFIKETDSLY